MDTRLFIGGQFVAGEGEPPDVLDPAPGEVITIGGSTPRTKSGPEASSSRLRLTMASRGTGAWPLSTRRDCWASAT